MTTSSRPVDQRPPLGPPPAPPVCPPKRFTATSQAELVRQSLLRCPVRGPKPGR